MMPATRNAARSTANGLGDTSLRQCSETDETDVASSRVEAMFVLGYGWRLGREGF